MNREDLIRNFDIIGWPRIDSRAQKYAKIRERHALFGLTPEESDERIRALAKKDFIQTIYPVRIYEGGCGGGGGSINGGCGGQGTVQIVDLGRHIPPVNIVRNIPPSAENTPHEAWEAIANRAPLTDADIGQAVRMNQTYDEYRMSQTGREG